MIFKRIAPIMFLLMICTMEMNSQDSENTGINSISNPNSLNNTLAASQMETTASRVRLAMTRQDYPVTPGDIYILSYLASGPVPQLNLFVDSDYNINMSIFGTLNASGMTFSELKDDIEEMVLKYYPDSAPQVLINSTGIFTIQTLGETTSSTEIQAWGLTRLSQIYNQRKTDYSNLRNITIQRNGTDMEFDLYRALHEGDLSQNPYVKPGDVIQFSQYEKKVSITGEIRRSGTFQITPEENLEDVINRYGRGLTQLADLSRITIVRSVNGSEETGEVFYIDGTQEDIALIKLEDLDSVYIENIKSKRPVVFFKGAIGAVSSAESGSLEASNRIEYVIQPGEKLSSAIQNLEQTFSPVSDLENAYIARGSNQIIPIDFTRILYHYDLDNDIVLEADDTIIIPFIQNFVTISGAVSNPGRYPYVPDRDADYYIALAGGRDEKMNAGYGLDIFTQNHEKKSKSDFIEPEDRIEVPANSFNFIITQSAPLLSLIASVAGIVISVITLIK